MFTFAVITCNRLQYLKNCLSSIQEFANSDDVDILLIDNNSVEEGYDDYLSSLKGVEIHQFKDRQTNELQRAMNFAIKYSKKKGNEFVNFIQEDYQYLWHDKKLFSYVTDTFRKNHHVVQINTNLIWKRKHKKIGKFRFVDTGGMRWIQLISKKPCDNGFTRVGVYDKIGMYPSKSSIHGREKGILAGEAWFGRKTKALGLQRYVTAIPNQGMMMDCAYVRGPHRFGKYIEVPNKYFLKPFDKAKIDMVKKRAAKKKFCFIEDMIEPDGWVPDAMDIKHSIRDIKVPVCQGAKSLA